MDKNVSHNVLTSGASAAMGIFDRADKMKTPLPPSIYTTDLTDEKSIEYFLKKAEDLENQYKKTEVHTYDPDGKLLSTVPTVNLEDGTDMSAGRTTLRNTLKGHLGTYKKIKVLVMPSGVHYPYPR